MKKLIITLLIALSSIAYGQNLKIYIDIDQTNMRLKGKIEDAFISNVSKIVNDITVTNDSDNSDLGIIVLSSNLNSTNRISMSVIVTDKKHFVFYHGLIIFNLLDMKEAIDQAVYDINKQAFTNYRKELNKKLINE